MQPWPRDPHFSKAERAIERANEGTRFYWLFERQGGLCYLGETAKCCARSRMMTLDKPKKGYRGSSPDRFAGACATWEHLIPRRISRVRRASGLKLLACYDCNAAKGCNGEPTEEHVRLALELGQAWYRSELFVPIAQKRQADLILIGMEAEAERYLARLQQSQGPAR